MRPRIYIRGSVCLSVGPSVHPSRVFLIADINKSDKSNKSLYNSIVVPYFKRIFVQTNLFFGIVEIWFFNMAVTRPIVAKSREFSWIFLYSIEFNWIYFLRNAWPKYSLMFITILHGQSCQVKQHYRLSRARRQMRPLQLLHTSTASTSSEDVDVEETTICRNEWMNEGSKWINECNSIGSLKRLTDGRTDGWTDGWTRGWTKPLIATRGRI